MGARRGLNARECLSIAQRGYEVFHVVIQQGYAAHGMGRVLASWRPLLGPRVLLLDDYRCLAEVVVSAIEVTEGADPAEVAASWSGAAGATVSKALAGLHSRPRATGLLNRLFY